MGQKSVAIDGPSGAGKSTLSKRLAETLGFLYVDTGAIYRTLALYALHQGVDCGDSARVEALLPSLEIDLRYGEDGLQHMYLHGTDVTGGIRQPEVSKRASQVSAVPAVRSFLMEMQRNLSRRRDVVMDGRDIGTIVLPDADVKIFLTATVEERARRRYEELIQRGFPTGYDTVFRDIQARDEADIQRAEAPLRRAEDALLVDTTGKSLEESFTILLNTVKERLPV